MAYNAAEPVRAATLDRFADAFAACGFQRASFYPCYGLAEATVFVTGVHPGTTPLVRRFDAERLEQGTAVEVDSGGRELVACGYPRLGQ